MSSQGKKPIFFNKGIKIGRPEQSLPPPPPSPKNISFLRYPLHPQSRRHTYITPYVKKDKKQSFSLCLDWTYTLVSSPNFCVPKMSDA